MLPRAFAPRGTRPAAAWLNVASDQRRGLVRLFPLAGDLRALLPSTSTPSFDLSYGPPRWVVAPEFGGQALYSDNGSAGINLGETPSDILPVFTEGAIAWWAFPLEPHDSGATDFWWSQNGLESPEFSAQHSGGGDLLVGSTVGSDTRIVVAATAANWRVFKWNNYIYTWDASGAWLYHNGVQIGTGGVPAPRVISPGPLAIGYSISAGRQYDGFLAHFAIYNRRLTARDAVLAFEPATRWDLLAQPSPHVFFPAAAAAAAAIHAPMGCFDPSVRWPAWFDAQVHS